LEEAESKIIISLKKLEQKSIDVGVERRMYKAKIKKLEDEVKQRAI
jgi:hypothetical protein